MATNDPDKSLSERSADLRDDADNPNVSDEEYETRRQELEKEWEEENRSLRNADGYE